MTATESGTAAVACREAESSCFIVIRRAADLRHRLGIAIGAKNLEAVIVRSRACGARDRGGHTHSGFPHAARGRVGRGAARSLTPRTRSI